MANISLIADTLQGVHLLNSSNTPFDLGFDITSTMATTETINTTAMARHVSTLAKISASYQRVHGYFSVIVCIFGIISNLLNIIVLTRKHMHSPTNFILTALAIADMLTMSTYPILAIYLYIITQPNCPWGHSKPWMYFVLFHNLFIITCHNVAMWLTVALAVFRYIFVCRHQVASTMCSMQRAKLTVLIVTVASVLSCIPYYFLYTIKDPDDYCGYWVVFSAIAQAHPIYKNFVHWMFGVTIKILPCILLAFLSSLLIIAMQQAKKRRARLLNNISRVIDSDGSNEHNRTTMMLVAVVLCFIVTELPQGIVAWISAVDKQFFDNVYTLLGDLMDILVLINSAVNFILYCIMSQQFRNTFKSLFVSKHVPPFFHRSKKHPNGKEYSMVRTETTNV